MPSPKSLHSPRYRRVVALLRSMRKRAGLSQKELADRLKRPRTFVTKCEHGDRRIDVIELIEYCRACGEEPGRLISQLGSTRSSTKR
jgi:transcriptional regulator with XRE-family HTH domain